jgi:hypothetical protein
VSVISLKLSQKVWTKIKLETIGLFYIFLKLDSRRKLKRVSELTIFTKNIIMEHIKLPSEIENLYKNQEISLYEARELIGKWKKLSKTEQKKHLLLSSKETNIFKRLLDNF